MLNYTIKTENDTLRVKASDCELLEDGKFAEFYDDAGLTVLLIPTREIKSIEGQIDTETADAQHGAKGYVRAGVAWQLALLGFVLGVIATVSVGMHFVQP